MCRLLGFASAAPTSLRALVGEPQLATFRALSRVHGDGWGTAWLERPSGEPGLRSTRSTHAAAADPLFADVAERTDAAARIVHLRWATPGYRVREGNTHPFVADGLAFAHNGVLSPTAALDELLAPATLSALSGDTDSERYFGLIGQELDALPGDPGRAAARAASALRARYPEASLNALLLTPRELVVVHANSPLGAPRAQMAAVPGGPPLDHLDAYFLMRWTRTADGSVVVASSGLEARDWTPLPEESVSIVDLESLELRHVELAAYGAAGLVA